MYIDDFYIPSTQLGFEPDFSGYIPDQNMQPYESPYDLQFDQRLQRDLTQQLQDYIQRQKPVETERKPKDYIVIDSGNTLSQLAKDYNTTVEDLARLNGIKDINRIKAGQVLRLNNKVANKYVDPWKNKRRTNIISKPVVANKKNNTAINKNTKVSNNLHRPVQQLAKPTRKNTQISTNNRAPKLQYTPESYKQYWEHLYQKRARPATGRISQPRGLMDVIHNKAYEMDMEKKREREILERYDREQARRKR